jgi:hypothetical protein
MRSGDCLALAISRRVAAQNSFVFGKVGFWRLVGIGLVIFGIGCAVGLGCYGYSRIIKRTEKTNGLASILSKALSNTQLHAKADGTVQLEPQDLSLAKDQTIALSNDSRLLLDRSATVKADGDLKVQLPSLPIPPATTNPTKRKIPLLTNFTVFKRVPFEKGAVMTGWIFLTSAQTAPTRQYCYYTASLDTPGFGVRVDVGTDGELLTPQSAPPGLDMNAAFVKCVWFRKLS